MPFTIYHRPQQSSANDDLIYPPPSSKRRALVDVGLPQKARRAIFPAPPPLPREPISIVRDGKFALVILKRIPSPASL